MGVDHEAALGLDCGKPAHRGLRDRRDHVRDGEGKALRAPGGHRVPLVPAGRRTHVDVIPHPLVPRLVVVKEVHRKRSCGRLARIDGDASLPVIVGIKFEIGALHAVGGTVIPRHEEDIAQRFAIWHREPVLAKAKRDNLLRVLIVFREGAAGDGCRHLLLCLDVDDCRLNLARLPVKVLHPVLRREIISRRGIWTRISHGEGQVARRGRHEIRNHDVWRRPPLPTPVHRIHAGGLQLAVGVRDVDRHFLRGVRLDVRDVEIACRHFRRAALQEQRGGLELAREEGARRRVEAIRVHFHDETVLRVDRAAVRVHPQRPRGEGGPGGHGQPVVPGEIVVLAFRRHSHVFPDIQRGIVLHRHLDRDLEFVVAGPLLGERHVHGHGRTGRVGIRRRFGLYIVVHLHVDAGGQGIGHLNGAREEVRDEVNSPIDVRGRGGEKHLRRLARRARCLDVERHARVPGVDLNLAIHLARFVGIGLDDPSATHDLGNVRVIRPNVKVHRPGGATVNRNRGGKRLDRGRPLCDGPPDGVRRLVGVVLVKVDRLHIDTRHAQVGIEEFVVSTANPRIPRPQGGREIRIVEKIRRTKGEIRRLRPRLVLERPFDGLLVVFQIVLFGACRRTGSRLVRELERQRQVAGLDRVFEHEIRVVPLLLTFPRVYYIGKPVGERTLVDALGLTDLSDAAHPQTQARLVGRELLQLVLCLVARQVSGVREGPGIRVTRIGSRLIPVEVDKAERDADRVADPQRFGQGSAIITVRIDDLDRTYLTRLQGRGRLGHST